MQALTGLAGPVGAAADVCAAPERIFAVDAGTGHLTELEACLDPAAITVVGEVDTGDWRSFRRLLAVADGVTTVVYAVTAEGGLEARRQDAPGAALGPPVEVGAGIDWTRFRALVSTGGGYLMADDRQSVRTFRHVDWATGGSAVAEGPLLFLPFNDWPAVGDLTLTGLGQRTHAEAIYGNLLWRVWRNSNGWMRAYSSGGLPHDVQLSGTLTGSEPGLYGVMAGAVVRLTQEPWPGYCPWNPNSWQVRVSLPGGWSAVVVPQRAQRTDPPGVGGFPSGPPKGRSWTCPHEGDPYQWQ